MTETKNNNLSLGVIVGSWRQTEDLKIGIIKITKTFSA